MRQDRSDDTGIQASEPRGGHDPARWSALAGLLRIGRGGWLVGLSVFSMFIVSPIRADVVHLANGQHVEGEVSDGRDGKIRVTIDDGVVIEFKPSEVKRIERKKSPSAKFDEKLAKITGADGAAIDALMDLARWAKTRRLPSRMRKAFRRVLKIDPHHPEARRGLGYVVVRNRWVHEKQLKGRKDLVQFGDEWMTVDEKERRLVDRLRQQVREDFRGVVSGNRFVQDYSIRQILERDEPGMRDVLTEFLDHSSSVARVVAVQALGRTYKNAREQRNKAKKSRAKSSRKNRKSGKGGDVAITLGDPDQAAAERARGGEERVANALLKMTLEETEADVRRALHLALIDIRQRQYFELALKAVSESQLRLHRERAADGILYDISKPWVPEVIDALEKRPSLGPTATKAEMSAGNAALLRILKRMFPVDLGYDTQAWRAWWKKNQARYRDE